jgi:hypothetical protein
LSVAEDNFKEVELEEEDFELDEFKEEQFKSDELSEDEEETPSSELLFFSMASKRLYK